MKPCPHKNTGTPRFIVLHLIVLHSCCIFYKLKAKRWRLTLLRWPGTKPAVSLRSAGLRIFMAAPLKTAKRWKPHVCPRWVDEQNVNPENTRLSQRRQSPKTTYCLIAFIWKEQGRQIHRDKQQISGCLGLGEEKNGEWLLMGTGLFFWDDGNVLKFDHSDSCTTQSIY